MRNCKLILTGIIALCFLLSSFSPAWTAEKKRSIKSKKTMKTIKTKKKVRKSAPQGRPDLIVRDIRLIGNCKIKVTLKNIGSVGVPDWVYSGNAVGVQMYRNNQGWGGMDLRVFDPGGILKNPGGTVSKIWFPGAANLNLGPGIHSIRVHVDPSNALPELKENNNILTKRLKCKKPGPGPDKRKPDLIVKDIKLIDNCKIKVILQNIGAVGVPNSYYVSNQIGVQMYKGNQPWGGIVIRGFDASGALQTPGGMASWVWFPGASNLNLTPGVHKIKVKVDSNNQLPEANENNNTLTKRLICQ